MYNPAALPTGPAFLKRPDSGTFLNRRLAENSLQFLDGSEASHNNQVERLTQYHDITSEYGWKKLRADYFANVTLVDEMVGMVVDALKEQGIYDDTVLAFTSEHGDMIGDHGMVQKMNMYEESARVPMLIRAPCCIDGEDHDWRQLRSRRPGADAARSSWDAMSRTRRTANLWRT